MTVKAGLAAFDADQPAAILLDIHLPDGSGLEVLYQIRHRQADAVVIMITANVLLDKTIGALRGGAYDFIGKRQYLQINRKECLENDQRDCVDLK